MGDQREQEMTSREVAERRRGVVVADRFRIEELLAFDGMGALYRVRDLERGRPAVLRALPESYTRDPELTSRFLRESQAVSDLGHSNIAKILATGKLDDGPVYAAMEFLPGQSIATIIRDEGRLSPSRAIHVATQVCRALATAHEHGLIHRDLKPESVILVAHEGDLDFAKVVDFGICKQVDDDGTTSAPRTIIGTPDSMAPEQAAGSEANVASDVYALGSILFEMVTGRRPFRGRNALDLLRQKGTQDAPRADAVAPEVPRPLAEVIARTLARAPEDRPESMRHLELELMRAAELSERARSESSGYSPLPPPPPMGEAISPAPPLPPPPPPRPSEVSKPAAAPPPPKPQPPKSQPTRPAPAQTPGPQAPATPKPAPEPEVTKSTSRPLLSSASGVLKTLPEADVAADHAGRSIVPIAIFGAVAVAVGLFVWPGVLRPQTDDPEGPKLPPAVATPEDEAAASGSTTAEETGATTTGEESGATAGESATAGTTTAEGGSATPPPGEPDLVVLVGKLELAAAEDRWRSPVDDNVALHLAKIEALEPKHEALARIRKRAQETLKARAEIAAGEKRWHDAVEAYRDLYAVDPTLKSRAIERSFGEVLQQEAKILRYVKDPEQMLLVADDLIRLDAKSFDGYLMRAEAYETQRRWAEAVEAFTAAKKLRPRESAAVDGLKRADKQLKAAGGAG